MGWQPVPLVPTYPSDEPDRRRAPDLGDVADRILNDDDPSPVVAAGR